ncbi:hypothetical protein CPter291_2715 [Collimonas pratensis]|uniref:Uncharacterized protein n=1 Tax=Collimonas pratensis TaxID=279113 RepID=A0A127Q4M5_9BURK|nr:hypothetical protein CPter91_2649 [Collimonas pratensis]AMP14972.1 hypothetical protein CPter291_2715 [Collimonas pratensis]
MKQAPPARLLDSRYSFNHVRPPIGLATSATAHDIDSATSKDKS